MGNTLAVNKDTSMNTILEAVGYISDNPNEGAYAWFRRAYEVEIGQQIGNRWSYYSRKLVGYRISVGWHLRSRHGTTPFKVATVKSGLLDLDEFKVKLDAMIAEAHRRRESQEAGEARQKAWEAERKAIASELGLAEPDYSGECELNKGEIEATVKIYSADRFTVEIEGMTKEQTKAILEAIKGLKGA